MNVCILLVCAVVTVAAAVRSTWSPCGLSMLSTITPLSEGAKGHSYRATSAWFVAGATAGGVSLGLVMAGLSAVVRTAHPSEVVVGSLALAASLVAAVSDAGVAGVRLPFHRRQVNERWLDHFRPSIYGLGFGWQIGTGVATYITSAAVYLMVVLGALAGHPLAALAVGTVFGMLRGTAVLLTRRVTDPSRLREFHRRFLAVGPLVGRVLVGVEVGGAAVLALRLGSLAAAGVAIVVLTVALGVAVAAAVVRLGIVGSPSGRSGPSCRRPTSAAPTEPATVSGSAPG